MNTSKTSRSINLRSKSTLCGAFSGRLYRTHTQGTLYICTKFKFATTQTLCNTSENPSDLTQRNVCVCVVVITLPTCLPKICACVVWLFDARKLFSGPFTHPVGNCKEGRNVQITQALNIVAEAIVLFSRNVYIYIYM